MDEEFISTASIYLRVEQYEARHVSFLIVFHKAKSLGNKRNDNSVVLWGTAVKMLILYCFELPLTNYFCPLKNLMFGLKV